MRCSVAVKTVQVNYDIVDQRASSVMAHLLPLIPSLRLNQALKYSKNALLVAFSTAAWFPSSYLRIPLPANMQEVVKMTRGCVARKTSATSGAQVNANRQLYVVFLMFCRNKWLACVYGTYGYLVFCRFLVLCYGELSTMLT